jgi:CO/xanthine dehydrogenase Mo-binding subunit
MSVIKNGNPRRGDRLRLSVQRQNRGGNRRTASAFRVSAATRSETLCRLSILFRYYRSRTGRLSGAICQRRSTRWPSREARTRPGELYGNPIFGVQVTGNSNSIRAFWDELRNAGAAARTMLIAAAAAQWQVDAASCSSSNGKITHAASNRMLTYGELADVAGKLPVPEKPTLKNPNDFALIGKPLKRFDTPNKSDGKTIYGIDVIVPDMKFATLAQCPVLGGKVRHVDAGVAKKLPGVQQIALTRVLIEVPAGHQVVK